MEAWKTGSFGRPRPSGWVSISLLSSYISHVAVSFQVSSQSSCNSTVSSSLLLPFGPSLLVSLLLGKRRLQLAAHFSRYTTQSSGHWAAANASPSLLARIQIVEEKWSRWASRFGQRWYYGVFAWASCAMDGMQVYSVGCCRQRLSSLR